MFPSQSYQLYRYEHGLSAAGQRAADVRAGEDAAALRDLRLCLRRTFRLRHRARSARVAAVAISGPVQGLPSAR
jgi:hypothetical protein